tara:strand:- start:758 stop:1246 length:489 start_codon:yes stop_codon:yes gene_type:complete
MRWLAIICLSASSVCAQITDDELSKISKEEIILTIKHLQRLTAESITAADKAIASEARVQAKLIDATDDLLDSQNQLLKVDQDIRNLQDHAEEQARIAVGASADAIKAQRLADHRGNLLGWLGAGLLCILCLRLTSILPAPYGFLLPVAAIPAGYWLARLLL